MDNNFIRDGVNVERGSDTAKNSGKAPKKKASISKGKARASKANAPLPEGHQNLLELFTAVDHAYCFLTRNSIPARVTNLQSMVWRLFPGRFGEEASFLPRMRRLADIAPTALALEVAPEDGMDNDLKEPRRANRTEAQRLEVRFLQKSTAGTGKAAVSRRQQLVRRALLEHASGTDTSPPTTTTTTSSGGGGGPIRGRREKRAYSSDVDRQVVDKKERRECPDASEPRMTSEIEVEADGICSRRRGDGSKSGTLRKTTARARSARLREQKGQPSTGRALSASDPLSMSPAYVLTRRDAGESTTGAAGMGDIFSQKDVPDPDVTHGKMSLPPSGEREEINYDDGRAVRKNEDADTEVSERLRFDPQRALEHLKALPIYEGQAVHTETLPGRVGEFADTAHPLHPEVAAALAASKGVTRLFKHQALAIDAARSGRHVSLSTATSSGKSVVFNVSVLEVIVGGRPDAVAFYLFPTKALAQDQLRSLKRLVGVSSYLSERVRPMTLDGDTPFSERGMVVEEANIIFTNPDMLHASILPGHKRFQRILGNLSHVVIDEAHVYRGAFGTHVSMVLRRLLRLWAVNASSGPPPQFICCSATMSEARSHFASLLPLEECLGGQRMLYSGDVDTAPAGKKTFVLWRPPIVEDWVTSKGEGVPKGSRFRGRQRRQHGLNKTSSSSKRSLVGFPKEVIESRGDGVGGVPAEDKSKAGVVSDVASLGLSLRGIEAWRTEPTDNFYNREYMKLMGTELPRRDSDPPAVLPDSVAEGVGQLAHVRSIQKSGSDPIKSSSMSMPMSMPCCSDKVGGGPLITLEGVVQGWGGGKGEGGGLNVVERRRPVATQSVAVSELGLSEEVVEEGALAGVGVSRAAAVVAADGKIVNEELDGDGGGVALGLVGHEAGVEQKDRRRRSPICETAHILAALVKQRVRTLAFCHTRKLTELTLRYGRQDLERSAPHLVSLVQGYRGGYTKDERRQIESRLFSNKLLGCTATCALELGVDIGELDVTLHLGFPGSVSSLRQQAGRAGRGGKDSLAIMVLFQDPISQYFLRKPAEVLHKKPEAVVLDSKNELVLRAHLLCAAAECPLGIPALGDVTDAALFGGEKRLQAVIDTLIGGDFPRLVLATGNLGWKANPGLDPPPCRRVGLRMIDPVSFSVVDDSRGGEQYDTVEYSRAFFTLFEGAIYLHQARQYLVTKLDLGTHLAHTTPVKVNYYTAGTNSVDVKVTKRIEVSDDNFAHTGCVDVVCTVYGFVKKQLGTGITLEKGECRLPPLQYATRAFWLDVGVTAKRAVDNARRDFEGGVHAVGHALLSVVPLFLLCDSEDVDCEHVRPYILQRPQPRRILIYDKRPGGVGIADAMFGCHRAVLSKALELVEGCPCPDGCVACIHDHGCTGYNLVIDKQAALIVLKCIIHDMMEAGQKASPASTTPVGAELEAGEEIQAQQRLSCTRRRQNNVQSLEELPNESIDGSLFRDSQSSGAESGVAADSNVPAMTTKGNNYMKNARDCADMANSSPRKKQRLRNLHLAKTMERAREQDKAVLGCWIPSVP